MNNDTDATERDLYGLKTLISDNVTLIGFVVLAAFVGHRSLGLPDAGVRAWHLLAIGIGGALAIWTGTAIVERRARARLTRGLRSSGFTEDEAAEQLRS